MSDAADKAHAVLHGEGVDRLLEDVQRLSQEIDEGQARIAEEREKAGVKPGEPLLGLFQEVRVTDPKTGGEKGTKPQRTDLLPTDVLLDVSEHYGQGAQKYAARNWERGYAWSLSYAALLRHLLAWWGGEDLDAEFQASHLRGVIFHALALRAFEMRGIGTDDRPGK